MTHSNEEYSLFDRVKLGVAAEDFLNSELGQHIQSRAQSEVNNSIDVLLDERASDEDIRRVRLKALHAKKAITWLIETIEESKYAEGILREEDK